MFRLAQAQVGRRQKNGSAIGNAFKLATLGVLLATTLAAGCAPGQKGSISFLGITYSYAALSEQQDRALFWDTVDRLSPTLTVRSQTRRGQGGIRFDMKTNTYPNSGKVTYYDSPRND